MHILLRCPLKTYVKKTGNEGYDLGKAVCYFELKGELATKPLMLSLPVAKGFAGIPKINL